MKLGILKSGSPQRQLARFGSYPEMFRKLLGEDAFEYVEFDVEAGKLPGSVDCCPAYLVTGSACGVYDAAPWIARLEAFLRQARGRAALVGICFGHQVMAHTFGGKVIKSPKGWGIGAQTYQVVRPQAWTGGQATITLPASHQDQVVALPPGAEVVACSGFAPYGLLVYEDQTAVSLQLHPEFEADFAIALAEAKRDIGMSARQVELAVESLRQPNDREVVAGWIRSFLTSAVAA